MLQLIMLEVSNLDTSQGVPYNSFSEWHMCAYFWLFLIMV